jgi:hypothetical protein
VAHRVDPALATSRRHRTTLSKVSEDLAQRARAVLDQNRRDSWTIPSNGLYPHQWLWDSCFIAMGLAHYDAPRAADELRALFRGQWSNGMLPHMVFAPGKRDVGSRRIWQSSTNASAPRDVETSCITQPPIVAVAAWRVAQRLSPADRRRFLTDMFPRLVAYHQWLYRERDLEHRGLVTLIHPWECGLDTTPPWMAALRRMSEPFWVRTMLRLRLAKVARFFRRDTRYLPAAERASDGDGLRMLALAQHAKRFDFDLQRMPRDSSVLIEDVAFNSLLAVSNQAVGHIARELGQMIDPGLERSFVATDLAIEELWDESTGLYASRDAVTKELLVSPTVAGFLPLWPGVAAPARARRLIGHLAEPSGFWPRFPVPSVAVDAPQFDVDRYWKGPTWVNTNWIIIEGLRVYAAHDIAEDLRVRTLALVRDSGFAEYFSAVTGDPYGADDFSWTAALTLDLLEGPTTP